MSSEGHNKPSRFPPYRHALKLVSARTGTPLPSLVVSFAVLHELTAIVPLVGIFYGVRTLGVGERLLTAVIEDDSDWASTKYSWIRMRFKTWVDEGEGWAGRVGRRYGVLGFEKGDTGGDVGGRHHQIVGDVANAVLAYGLTKALLPFRIGLSLYLSPAFSRGLVEPIRSKVMRPFRRSPP